MGSTERIRNVAKRVAKWARAGQQMVVVPSAMSGETNRLLGLAKELAPTHTDTQARASLPANSCVASLMIVIFSGVNRIFGDNNKLFRPPAPTQTPYAAHEQQVPYIFHLKQQRFLFPM